MQNLPRTLALIGNAVFFFVIFGLFADNAPNNPFEWLCYALLFAFPLLNLYSLCSLPDREERLLRRQVNKAELRKRLKELGENQAPAFRTQP